MPVIECSCGMMMSISATEPRTCCIRCGGVEFRLIEKLAPVHKTLEPFMPRSLSAANAHAKHKLAIVGLLAAEPIGEGAYI
ncbi:MAG: hypothetical protein WD468_01345 [Pirellulales bacterium]